MKPDEKIVTGRFREGAEGIEVNAEGALLAAAIFTCDDIDPDTLVRYCDEPESLSPEVKEDIERLRRARPWVADQIAVLSSVLSQGFPRSPVKPAK